MNKANRKRWIAALSVSALVLTSTAIGFANTVEAKAEVSDKIAVTAASVRVVDGTYGAGIRFQILMDKATYTTYAEGTNAVLGAKLIPAYYLGSDTLETTTSDKVYTATESVWNVYDDGDGDTSNDKMEGVVYVYNIPKENYGSDLVIAAYASADGQTELYSEQRTFSFAQVAQSADGAEGSTYANYYTFNVTIEGDRTTAKYGEKLTNPDTTGGYYYTNVDGTKIWDFDNMTVKGDVTLVRQANKYNVSISSVGNCTFSQNEIENVPYGTKVSIEGNTLTVGETVVTATPATGYILDSWGMEDNGAIEGAMTITPVVKEASSYFNTNVFDADSVDVITDWTNRPETTVENNTSKTAVAHYDNSGTYALVAFKTTLSDNAMDFFVENGWSLRVTFKTYYSWNGSNNFEVRKATLDEDGNAMSFKNITGTTYENSNELEQTIDLSLAAYTKAIDKSWNKDNQNSRMYYSSVDNKWHLKEDLFALAFSRVGTLKNAYTLDILSVNLVKSVIEDPTESYWADDAGDITVNIGERVSALQGTHTYEVLKDGVSVQSGTVASDTSYTIAKDGADVGGVYKFIAKDEMDCIVWTKTVNYYTLESNLLDANSVDVTTNWGNKLVTTVENNTSKTAVTHADSTGTYALVTFKTTLTDDMMNHFVENGWSLRITFKTYHTWNGDSTFEVGKATLDEGGNAMSYQNVTKTTYENSNVLEQTIDLSLAAYTKATDFVLVFNRGGTQKSAYTLEILSVNLVKEVLEDPTESYWSEDVVTDITVNIGERLSSLQGTHTYEVLKDGVSVQSGTVASDTSYTIAKDGADVSGIYQFVAKDEMGYTVWTKTVNYYTLDSLLNRNLLDASSVLIKSNWGNSISTTVDGDMAVATGMDGKGTIGSRLVVSFETTLQDNIIAYLLGNGYSLEVSFITYYGSWVDGPFAKGGVALNGSTVKDGFDGITLTDFTGSKTDAQTLTIDFDAYYTALKLVRTNGLGRGAYSFVIERKANNGNNDLKIVEVKLVAPGA